MGMRSSVVPVKAEDTLPLGPAPRMRPGWPVWFSSGVTANLSPDGSLLVTLTPEDLRGGLGLTPIEVEKFNRSLDLPVELL